MKKEDFLRLENQSSAWTAISYNAKQKNQNIEKKINLKKDVAERVERETTREEQLRNRNIKRAASPEHSPKANITI
jgi:RNA polymerase-binding transcription factor DksA